MAVLATIRFMNKPYKRQIGLVPPENFIIISRPLTGH